MNPATTYVTSVDNTFIFIVAVSVVLLILISFLMVFFVFKYSRKRNPKATNIEGNIALEITWTIIPVILTLAMFYFGWVGYVDLSNPPQNAMVIKVTGQMWKWNFEYDNGLKTDTLYVPLSRAVRLNLSSQDVNHSFFIPAFRFKKDVMQNRETMVWFRTEKLGSYDIACAEYCGLQHSQMYTKVIVLTPENYTNWYNSQTVKMKAPSNLK
jgi:cytochrome c oxidase subunit 2